MFFGLTFILYALKFGFRYNFTAVGLVFTKFCRGMIFSGIGQSRNRNALRKEKTRKIVFQNTIFPKVGGVHIFYRQLGCCLQPYYSH